MWGRRRSTLPSRISRSRRRRLIPAWCAARRSSKELPGAVANTVRRALNNSDIEHLQHSRGKPARKTLQHERRRPSREALPVGWEFATVGISYLVLALRAGAHAVL